VLCVGLTGILGAGKSTVGRVLSGLGAVVIDADQVEREVLGPGTVGEREVLAHFAGAGQAVARPDGSLDRGGLAKVVFSDPELRKALEAISHPLIEEAVSARVARVAAELPTAVVVIELPLLDADRRLRYRLDFVVLVDAPEELAVGRAVRQRGMSEQDVRARLAAQPSQAERRAVADRVLTNTGSREELEAAVGQLWASLSVMAARRARRG
jgi:dephospho-CoA kinase